MGKSDVTTLLKCVIPSHSNILFIFTVAGVEIQHCLQPSLVVGFH